MSIILKQIGETEMALSLEGATLFLTTALKDPVDEAITLELDESGRVLGINQRDKQAVRQLRIVPPDGMNAQTFERTCFAIITDSESGEQDGEVAAFIKKIAPTLSLFGVTLLTAKKKAAKKAQHRFKKDIANVLFRTAYRGSRATITWSKRDEVVIEPGAQLAWEVPLNADGKIGFSARFALKLREEQRDTFNPKNLVTHRKVILRSINEAGLFLFFGGTNSWLQFKDANGKTIDEWTRV